MGSCAPAVPRHRRSARWKWSKISAGGDELLERHAPECAAKDSTQAPHNLPRRQARSGAEVGRLEAAAMANGCDEAGGRVSLSEYPGYRLRLGVHLYESEESRPIPTWDKPVTEYGHGTWEMRSRSVNLLVLPRASRLAQVVKAEA